MSTDRSMKRVVAARIMIAVAILVGLSAIAAAMSRAAEVIRVDCGQDAGVIRPLHGVNGGARVQAETMDLRERWKEIGIPVTRLHDCEWPLPNLVDMHAIFPRPEADPQDPNSYQFKLTDSYIQAIVDTGATIVYRLGESIEHSDHKQYVHPPADTDRWAAACVGVVRHYNDGWAGGFHHNIQHWEIWNEPENRPAMWSGSDEDYYDLYTTAAKAIKSRYPNLLVGGPAVGATGEFEGETWGPTPFLAGFIQQVTQQNAPLDFFSWHTYTNDPDIYARKARAIRTWLDDRGFAHTKIHLNEWNYLPQNDWTLMLQQGDPERRQAWFDIIGSAEGAAFTACVLAYLQDSPVDVANYYSGDTNSFGLFGRYGVPHKTFYAMKAFRQLLDTPHRVPAIGWKPGTSAAIAGVNQQRDRVNVLLSNLRDVNATISLEIERLPWQVPTRYQVLRVDVQHDLRQVADGTVPAGRVVLPCELPAPSVLLVQFQPINDEAADPVQHSTTSNDRDGSRESTDARPPSSPTRDSPMPEGRPRLLPLRNIVVDSVFWSPKLDIYRQRTIPHSWQYMGWELRSLKHAVGEPVEGDLNGTWGEANLYKFLETCAYSLAQAPDPALQKQVDDVIELLARAQRPDGYLHVYVTNNGKLPWDPVFLDGSHDGYVLGHMIEAAIEYHSATGDDAFLHIARRAADQAYRRFLGPEGAPGFCGHAELEMALVELYRLTDEPRYLELARAFVEWRGHGKVIPCSETPRAYFQDAAPLRQQKTLEGHAVRAIFFATGVADLALETGDVDYRLAANRFWNSTVRRRMTITGSIGPRAEHEAIGEDHELPQDGYYESCAACGLADFAQRMFLLERRSEYADVLERVLYNAVLHGLGVDGTTSYYQNPLSDHDRPRYNSWVCCPPNLSRTLMQIGRYALAHDGNSVFVNLFVGGSYSVPLSDGVVPVKIETNYPWDGKVQIELAAEASQELALHLRVPDWCRSATFQLNDQPATRAAGNDEGYVVVQRKWNSGDRVRLNLEMPPTWMEAHPSIRACEGQVALQRGPLVYAFEGLDNGGNVDFLLGNEPSVEMQHRLDLLGGVTVATTRSADGRSLTALPFYVLGNRQNSCQEVWRPLEGFAASSDWWLGELYRPVSHR